ncbi:MAG: methyltransferase domain-containing protein [Deltaproteobacteria bacterium]|nr:methyltransferase domain-containing protein [Deltaproteobacteria bacterium]
MEDNSCRRRFIIYDWLAPLYDLGVWFLFLLTGGEDRIRGRVLAWLEPLRPESLVLELCCGTATLSLRAAVRGANAIALDNSPGMLAVAREKAERLKTGITLIRADATTLPFREGAFDRVIASLGLHELGRDRAAVALSETMRVLKKGGRLVIFDYHKAEGAAGWIEKLIFAFLETNTAEEWIAMDIQSVLRQAGFKDFRRSYYAQMALQLVSADKP